MLYVHGLCAENEYRVCDDLFGAVFDVRGAHGELLAVGPGACADGREVADCELLPGQHNHMNLGEANGKVCEGSRSVWIYGLHGWLVDFLCADARLSGLSLPDPSWGYQSYHQRLQYESPGKRAV